MPSYAAIAPIAQHRGREPQLAGDLHQWPTAARQQGDRLRLELIRKMTPFLTHSTPSRSSRSLPKVSTNPGEAHPGRLLDGHLHDRLLDLRRRAVLQDWLPAADLLQGQLAPFVVQLLEAIEA